MSEQLSLSFPENPGPVLDTGPSAIPDHPRYRANTRYRNLLDTEVGMLTPQSPDVPFPEIHLRR